MCSKGFLKEFEECSMPNSSHLDPLVSWVSYYQLMSFHGKGSIFFHSYCVDKIPEQRKEEFLLDPSWQHTIYHEDEGRWEGI